MSALTAQLQRLQNRSGGMHTALTDKTRAAASGIRAVPTILFTPTEARNITREQLLELALVGLRSLVAVDNRFARPAAFLFSDAHTRKERAQFTRDESDKVITPAVEEFLALLAPHVMEPAALQVLEYLIRVFEIHEFNASALLRVILPAHDQGLFIRVLYIMNLGGTGFEFLRNNKATGTVLPRATLVTAAKENPRVLETICDIADSTLKKKIHHPAAIALFSFVASSIATTQNSEQSFRQILPVLIEWLPRARTNPEHSAAAQFVLFVWSNESRFSVDIIRVIFSTLCKLCRNLSPSTSQQENNNNNTNKQHLGDADEDEASNKALLDAYRLLAHLFNSQKAVITASATANASTGGDYQLQSSLVAQIVNLPFNKRALTSFLKVSPWGFSLLMKQCFGCNFDDQESSFEFIEQCLASLPLGQIHVQQILIQLAQIFSNTMITSSSSSSSTNQNSDADNNTKIISAFCERSVRILERRFSNLFDLALAELLKLEASFAQSITNRNTNGNASATTGKEAEVITTFVLKYCTGSKYEIVDLSSSNNNNNADAMKLPLIAALVHPVSGIRRLAAAQLHPQQQPTTVNNKKNNTTAAAASVSSSASPSPALQATFIDLLALIEHTIKNESETTVLRELFLVLAYHVSTAFNNLAAMEEDGDNQDDANGTSVFSSSTHKNDENNNSNNSKTSRQNQLISVLFEGFKALMRVAPSTVEEVTAPTTATSNNDTKSKFLKLAQAFGTVLTNLSSNNAQKDLVSALSLSCTICLSQLESFLQVSADNKFFADALAALNIDKGKSSSSSSSISFWNEQQQQQQQLVDKNNNNANSIFSSSSFLANALSSWNHLTYIAGNNNSNSNQVDESKINAVNNMNSKQKLVVLIESTILLLLLPQRQDQPTGSGDVEVVSALSKVFPLIGGSSNNNNNNNNNNIFSFIAKQMTFPLAAVLATSSSNNNNNKNIVSVASLLLTAAGVAKSDSAIQELFNLNNANNKSFITDITLTLVSGVEAVLFNNNQQQQAESSLVQAVRNSSQLFNSFGNFLSSANAAGKETELLLLSLALVSLFSLLQSSRTTSSHNLHLAFTNAFKELNDGIIQKIAGNNNNNAVNSSAELKFFASEILRQTCQQLSGLGSNNTNNNKNNNNTTTSAVAPEKLFANILLPNLLPVAGNAKSGNNSVLGSLAASAPTVYSRCFELVTPFFAVSTSSASSEKTVASLFANSVAPLLKISNEITHSPLPLQALVSLVSSGNSNNNIRFSVVSSFLENSSSPIKLSLNSAGTASTTLLSKFPAEFIIGMIPEFVVASSSSSAINKVDIAKKLLDLQRRGCDGVTAAFARSSQLFEVLVSQILVPLFGSSSSSVESAGKKKNAAPTKNNSTTSTLSDETIQQISICAECIKFTLQEKSSIEAEIENNKKNNSNSNHGAEMSLVALTAAQICVSTSLATLSTSTNAAASSSSSLLRATLLSTASSCLEFCVNFKSSLSASFFFLTSTPAVVLSAWTPLVLAYDAATVHATMTLIEAAVTLVLASKDAQAKSKLSSEALNLLATVVMGAFEQKNNTSSSAPMEFGAFNIAGLVRYSPTAAVQRLMKVILPALVGANTDKNSKAASLDESDDDDNENNNNNNSDDDDDDDAPPVIFSRNKSNVLNKYTNNNNNNKKGGKHQNQQTKQAKKTPEELRAIAEKRRQNVLDIFERAKTNLSLPLIALLIKMKEVASAAQLQFKSPNSVLADIVCSFDIIDQMSCFRGMLEVWKSAMNHAKGYGVVGESATDAVASSESLIHQQMKATDLRPFASAIASFLQTWVEDSRFIDGFVKANTAAVVDALREQALRGGGSNTILSLVRTAPTLAPFCDSIFSSMSLFQLYKILSLQENDNVDQELDADDANLGNNTEQADEEDENNKNKNQWFVRLIGSILATMLSMIDEELFVVCIREIVVNSKVAVFSSAANNNSKNRSIAAVASRRIGLEILCDRLALSTTLGGSSARYTSKTERIARGATAILSERVAQRILELLHRLLKELTVSVEVPEIKNNNNNNLPLEKASSLFTRDNQQQQQNESKNGNNNNNNNNNSTSTAAGSRRQRGDNNNDETEKVVIENDNDDDDDREGVSETNKQYRGMLRRTLLRIPRENLLDVQWTVMCCEESARCFGAVKGDQLGLVIGTLARIGLDAVCFRGRVFPTVPTYRGVEHVSSCAWKSEDQDDEEQDSNKTASSTHVVPVLFESNQLVLLCSIATAVSIVASTLGPSRMISTSGNDTLNLLTTSIRYSARMTHQIQHNNNNNNNTVAPNGETKEALRQLRSISLAALRRSLPSTWTLVEPFLPHIISSVTSHSLSEDADTSAPARELLGELDSLLEPRVLFPCIAEALQQSYPDTHSFALLFQVIQNLISRLSKPEIKEIPSLMNCELFTVAFDKFADQKPLAPVDTLRAAFSAFASFIVKFRETTSKALCSNIVVWATSSRRSAKQAAPRPNEIQRWTLCMSLFEYVIDRLGEVSEFVFPVVSPVIVDTLSTLSTTSTAPLVVQQYVIKNASQEATTCLESAFNCIRRMADIANEAAEQTTTATDSPDTPEALLPYFARPGPFEAIRDPLAAQLGNVTLLSDGTLDFSGRAQETLIPCLRSIFKSLRNPKLWSEMQAAFLRSLRQPSPKSRLAVLSLLRVIYADGGDTLASLVLAEALPSIVEATEDMDAKVADEARLFCRELSTITGQDVLEYMTA